MESHTTDKHDVGKAIFLERLLKAWEKAPDMRLGQLIIESLVGEKNIKGAEAFMIITLRHLEDSQLAEAIERYVLTRA
jgi:hypothetical protein